MRHYKTTPSPHNAALAQKAVHTLTPYADQALKLQLPDQNQALELPAEAVNLLLGALQEIAEGNALTLIPQHAELSTFEAADILNVSRPYLVKLLENDAIPYHKVGTHHRIYLQDVLAYKEKIDHKQRAAMAELIQDDQANDMGY